MAAATIVYKAIYVTASLDVYKSVLHAAVVCSKQLVHLGVDDIVIIIYYVLFSVSVHACSTFSHSMICLMFSFHKVVSCCS